MRILREIAALSLCAVSLCVFAALIIPAWLLWEFFRKLGRFAPLLLAIPTFGASWYVDSAATGSQNGTSWANAWTNGNAIVWSSVSSGDTIYVSGGAYGSSKTYANGITAGKSGGYGNPITVKVGQERNHNGLAILPFISFDTRTNIVFDGSRNASYQPPFSLFALRDITNNIGLRTTRATGVGIFLNGAAGQNNTARYIEVGPHGTSNNVGTIHGIQLQNISGALSNLVFEYLWVHDIQNDGWNANLLPSVERFDAITLRHSIIERTGDDGAQSINNGFTIQGCILADHWLGLYNGHPDQLQFSGTSRRWMKVLNNIFRNKGNSLVIGEFYAEEGGLLGPLIVAGNIFYDERSWVYITNGVQNYGATFDVWRPNSPDTNVAVVTWTNLVFANNDIYYQRTTPFQIGRADPAASTRSAWKVLFADSLVANNVSMDSKWNAPGTSAGFNIQGDGDPGSGTNGIFYTTNQLPAINNTVAGPTRSMSYHGVSSLDASTHGMGNSTNMPKKDTNTYSFAILSGDTAATDTGADLSAWTNLVPTLIRDLAGNVRGAGSGWDRGAREASGDYSLLSTGLVLSIPFNESLVDDVALDMSGNGNHGYHFGYSNGLATNRWPTSGVFTNTLTGRLQGYAEFNEYRDGWGLYGRSGDYVAVTNVANGGLQNLSSITVAFWAYRGRALDADTNGVVEWEESQGRYVSGGFGYTGAWTVGMFSDRGVQRSYLRFYAGDNSSLDRYVTFGSSTDVLTSGGTDEGQMAWVHLAFTMTNGIWSTFTNGVLCSTNVTDQSGTTASTASIATIRGVSGATNLAWLAIGCDTHNGKPYLDPSDDSGEQYPNHAWFNGGISDLRIWNRALSAAELVGVARGESVAAPGGGSGGGGAPATPRNFNATTVNSTTVNATTVTVQ